MHRTDLTDYEQAILAGALRLLREDPSWGRGVPRQRQTPDVTPSTRRRFSDAQVAEVRVRLARGETGRALAREYGVARSTVHRIGVGETYREAERNGDG